MRALVTVLFAVLVGLVAAPAGAQDGTRTCWCFSWVHGPDHGTDCFNRRASCRQGRADRGGSGESRPCQREEHPACERIGFHDGRGMNLGPSRPGAASLLGRTRARVERDLGPPTGTEGGWVMYGPRLAIRYEGGRAVRLRARVPDGFSCQQAAEWEGFADAGAPLRRSDGCEWPGQSLRHRIDPAGRFAGRLDLGTATLEVWVRASR